MLNTLPLILTVVPYFVFVLLLFLSKKKKKVTTESVNPDCLSHQEALNKIMSCACAEFSEPVDIIKNNGVREYWITLHCSKLLVKAKPLSSNSFEIISIQKECEIK